MEDVSHTSLTLTIHGKTHTNLLPNILLGEASSKLSYLPFGSVLQFLLNSSGRLHQGAALQLQIHVLWKKAVLRCEFERNEKPVLTVSNFRTEEQRFLGGPGDS